jgi:TPR repeat protein
MIAKIGLLAVLLLGMAHGPTRAGPLEDGLAAYHRRDFATALRHWRPLAEQGNANAQFNLGFMYGHGAGVSQSSADAMKWYRLAADQGLVDAQFNLGLMYQNGQGVPQNYPEAARWHRKAADQGHASAGVMMAIFFAEGRGVPQDDAVAMTWARWSAERGNADAQFIAGRGYQHGKGVGQDLAEAARWYRKAAEQGNADAQETLGRMYEYGEGVRRDGAEGLRWSRMAADQGHASAQYIIGLWHFTGRNVRQDYAEAARWYRKAAEQGHPVAQMGLAFLYESGDGVPQDFIQAHKWYNLSASQNMRERLAKRMTVAQIAEAQRLASAWQPRRKAVFDPNLPWEFEQAPAAELRLASTGSGFFVTLDGHVLTNAHVLKGCKTVQTRRADGDGAEARVVATSLGDDLALLKVEKRQATAVAFRNGPPARQGEGVTVYGFPLTGLLASTGNLTIGHLTALSGPRDDPRLLQISAAIQQGNSGGPVFDSRGNVVGVVVSKLDALAVAGATGDIPQNINFAIKASVATNFLEAQGIAYLLASGTAELATTAIVARARATTVRVDCLKPAFPR